MTTTSNQVGWPTIGVLAGWQYYWTPTPLSYLNPIFHGIRRAASQLGCNLLLGCGMGSSATAADPVRPAWPTLSPEADFIPIGPLNTDGLVVVNPLHAEARSREIQALIEAGHPVTFVAAGEHGATIVADNAAGIREAMEHLVGHGHRRIAFIAGSPEDMAGDTGDRLAAYEAALSELGLERDERLRAYGRHTFNGGHAAMRQILDSCAPFTAVVASNDESALGAMQALGEAGLRVPQDIGIIGFDDRRESVLQRPALSSVAVPLFELGYRAVEQVLRQIQGHPAPLEPIKVPTRLVRRESCGCGSAWRSGSASGGTRPSGAGTDLEGEDASVLRRRLHESFKTSVEQRNADLLDVALADVLSSHSTDRDEMVAWQTSLAVVMQDLPALAESWEGDLAAAAQEIAKHAGASLAESAWREHRRYAVDQRWTFDRLGQLTERLLNALDETQVYEVLAERLPGMGIAFAAVVMLHASDGDPVGWSDLRTITPPNRPILGCATREFPPPGLWPGDGPFSLALLPLTNPRGQLGFVAFDSGQLDLYGSIVQQLAGALHAAQLYAEAQEGRRLAEEANKIKSRFLSTVSHELRTPLNLIVGLSEILLREGAAGKGTISPAEQRDLEQLNANAQHLGRLISDVLDLASSDAGRLRLTYQYVDLGQLLRVVAETGRQLAIDKGLRWFSDLPESGPWVWGDRTRLSQVAYNLVSNAIKFTPRGEVRLVLKSTAASVTISVRDTGLGIPLAEQSTIFDEFRRSERSIERGYGGLGLGLAICKRLIELHGGTIEVQSTGQEGAGSLFYFTLPVVEPPAVLALTHGDVIPADVIVPEAGILVLTASVNASERLRDHLQQRGIEVQIALFDEPASWQTLLLTAIPSAIVLDVSLATDQGWHALKTLKANPSTQSIPVLFYALSQASGPSWDSTLPPEGAAASVLELDYLTKPIELASLTRALDQQWLAPTAERPVRKFLVVDDDPDTLQMHARIVQARSPSHLVFKARNGLEALQVLQSEQVDLVLLDMMMPEMDGFAVLEAMRERPSTRDIPVIVVTGQMLTEPEMARLNLGVTKVLSKGVFSLEETLSHLDAALARRRELSSEAQRLVRQAMAYMQAHYAEPLSREQIAGHVGLSNDYLTACFHKELGLAPIAYLNRYRVQQARQLLKHTHKSITEIALDVGFSSSSYFSRIFHRETGMSPAEFRHT